MTSVFSAVGAKLKAQQQHKHEQQQGNDSTHLQIYTRGSVKLFEAPIGYQPSTLLLP